jgi:hypothetical protein
MLYVACYLLLLGTASCVLGLPAARAAAAGQAACTAARTKPDSAAAGEGCALYAVCCMLHVSCCCRTHQIVCLVVPLVRRLRCMLYAVCCVFCVAVGYSTLCAGCFLLPLETPPRLCASCCCWIAIECAACFVMLTSCWVGTGQQARPEGLLLVPTSDTCYCCSWSHTGMRCLLTVA